MSSKMFKLAALTLAVTSVTACQSVPTNSNTNIVSEVVVNESVKRINENTSTQFVKDGKSPFPIITRSQKARVTSDFNNDGYNDWFYAINTFTKDSKGKFAFHYQTESGRFVERVLTMDGCEYPSKAVVNDFNNDGKPDVFVACSGWDAEPFPGEQSKLVLSGESFGSYSVKTVMGTPDYRHGATSADFDGDGNADILATEGTFNRGNSSLRLQLYYGDGKGNFPRNETLKLPSTLKTGKMYATVETVDANNDGHFDLAIGGNEWSGEGHFTGTKTKLFLNTSGNGFKPSAPINIKPVKYKGMVLDFDSATINGENMLFVMRSGDGSNDNFYKGFHIQMIRLTDNQSITVANDENKTFMNYVKVWTENGNQYVGSDVYKDSRLAPIRID